jgi:hypothetical protein
LPVGSSQLLFQLFNPSLLQRHFVFVVNDHQTGTAALTLCIMQLQLSFLQLCFFLLQPYPHRLLSRHQFRILPFKFVDPAFELCIVGVEVDVVAGEGEFDAVAVEGTALPDLQFLEGALGVDEVFRLSWWLYKRCLQTLQFLNGRTMHHLLTITVLTTPEGLHGRATAGFFLSAPLSVKRSLQSFLLPLMKVSEREGVSVAFGEG